MSLTQSLIGNGSISATITNFGASLTDLRLSGVDHSLVLGYPDVEAYRKDHQFMGAVIGRYANRISGGHAAVAGQNIALEKNENGSTHLHGGTAGFSHQIWTIVDSSAQSVTLTLESPDGNAGYPGTMLATANYQITGSTLHLTLSATSSKDTLVNLCHHPYFNLDGRADIDHHRLLIFAPHYLPSGADLLPTGEIAPVEGSDFDFTRMTSLRSIMYNNTFCIHEHQIGPMTHAATLQSDGILMELHTTQPGLHLYNGYKLKPGALGHGGQPYDPLAGVCLEAQSWPDSPNQKGFPSVALPAGQTMTQTTCYKFSKP